ncbi:MAG TPA: mannosyltransferase family protein [Solirubrobacteraceae bacterium]|nr:mannosyltransferase family protein [Solirubrobacteraceae bacterium]
MSVEQAIEPPVLSADVLAPPEREPVDRPRSTPRDTLRVLLSSRLLIWIVGCLAVLLLGTSGAKQQRFDPGGISRSLGSLGNVLAAPAVRWDAIWYLQIANHGYQTLTATRFFPVFPALVAAASGVVGSTWVAGVLISVLASIVAFELVRRLTELELGAKAANSAIALLAFTPMALYFSAVYSESVFLALSAGTLYAARRRRWASAGGLGTIAAATRVTGVLLVVPVLLFFLYGPEDAGPTLERSPRWRPRRSVRTQIVWAVLIPIGLAAFAAYLALRGYGPLAFVHSQQRFAKHRLTMPVVTIWYGVLAAWHQVQPTLDGAADSVQSSQAIFQCAALLVAGSALLGTIRRLPIAYGAYALLSFIFVLSSPTVGDPLVGFARYATVLFPLYMYAGAWVAERRALRPMLIGSAVLLTVCTIQFATWHVVGTLAI